MADEFQLGSGNWWDDASRNRFNSGTTSSPASIPTTLANQAWPADMKSGPESGLGLHGGLLANPNLQIMGLGLCSPSMDWNVQSLLRAEKAEGSFRSFLEEDTGSNRGYFSQSSSNDSTITSQNITASFLADSAAAYGLLTSEKQQQHQNEQISYPYPSSGYNVNYAEVVPSWNKFPQLSAPPSAFGSSSGLHFGNSTPPLWTAMNDARSSFSPPSHVQHFDKKPKNTSETRNVSTTTKKSSTEASNKRPRSETQSPSPVFKVKKEKMGDRITALQQLVSPFGKTDQASVYSEAIEYIKFLHEQIGALSAPYMKIGAHIQHQQNSEKSRDRQDLRSRGLCLVPVSSTFPVTNETTLDFWTPTFGGSFR